MKTPSNRLFNLIKSLNKHEKRYFKINLKGKNLDNSYVKLFDAIDKQQIYDELKLKKKLKSATLLKNFKVIKSYLFEALLSSLAAHYNNNSVNSQLRNLLQQAEILENKRQVEIALKLLTKAEKIAITHEKYEYLLLIFSLRTGIIRKSGLKDEVILYLKTGSAKEQNYIDYIKNAYDYKKLAIQLEQIDDKGVVKFQSNNGEKLKSIISSPLLSSSTKALTFSSLRYFYYIHFIYSSITDNWNEDAFQKQKAWVDYIESQPSKLINRAENYLAALSRFMIAQFYTNRPIEASSTFNKGKLFYLSLPEKIKNKNLLAFIASLTSNYMANQLLVFSPNNAISAWVGIRKSIDHSKLSNNLNMVIYGNLVYGYFFSGNYRDSLRHINKIINMKSDSRMDIQKEARIMLLLIYFELEHYEILPQVSKSSFNWILKNKILTHPFEDFILNFFSDNSIDFNNKSIRLESFKQFKEGITNLIKKDTNKEFNMRFDFVTWVDSKMKNLPILNLLKEKAIQSILSTKF